MVAQARQGEGVVGGEMRHSLNAAQFWSPSFRRQYDVRVVNRINHVIRVHGIELRVGLLTLLFFEDAASRCPTRRYVE